MSQPPLIRALLDARRTPLAPPVELLETHASWVLLTATQAYKIKKPITLPFLDYGSLERRRDCCAAELRLNRRYAPQLYRAVVAFTGSAAAPQLDGPGPVVEYAVAMERFAEAGRLDHLCRQNALTPAHISLLAQEIAAFHGAAATAPLDSRFGTPAAVLDPALENFTELLALLPDRADQAQLGALQAWTQEEFTHRQAAFAARRHDGRIRECHGDLHLGNLVLIDGRVVPFDCIEFNEDFRWIDVAAELAFTLVDLLDHGQPGLAGWLLTEWLSVTGDFAALRVLRFYAVYRALVRAKVAAIRAAQEHGAAADRERAAARGYIALADMLRQPPQPTLTITCGVSGSGKSHAAKRQLLADPHGATVRLRSDVERKRLFGLAATAPSGSPTDGGIYRPEAHVATYQRLLDLARDALAAGWSVIVDAAFLKRAERQRFRDLAATAQVAFTILACDAPVDELRRRIAARRGDASEATLEVLERQLVWREALDDAERACVVENVPN